MYKFARCFLLLIVFVLPTSRALSAQEMPSGNGPILPAEHENDKDISENTAYLINTKLENTTVDLIWDGYWRIRLAAGGTFGRRSSQNIYPDLQRGVIFTQEPDLKLSLWLNKRWFIETVFQGSFERNSYRAGYIGQGDEFVQEVIVGNNDVSATAYAGMNIPLPHRGAPGISAKFLTPKSKHEILFRFDPIAPRKKVFQGQYEVSTQDIGLMEFVEGKYFILPDKNISNFVVYLEDRNGPVIGRDGFDTQRRYRLAQNAEYFVDNQNGLLELRASHDGQVIVYYENQNSRAVGTETVDDFIIKPDSNLKPQLSPLEYAEFEFDKEDIYDPDGRKFEKTSRVNINGKGYLILYEPGRFTPFERQNVYRSNRSLPEESWRIVPQLRDRGALYPNESIDFGFIASIQEKTITVYGAVGSTEGLRDPANRYPFAISDPQVYGPGRETDPAKLSKMIVLTIKEKNSGYYLGSDVVPGSVVVHINGIRDKTVKISEDGQLIFSHFIYLDDWIEVSFRIENSKFAADELFIYQGNQFQLTPQLTLELAESIRWNINREQVVYEYEQSSGEITVATSLDWETANAGIRLEGDVTLSSPDTTGRLRLFGMEDEGLTLSFFESTLVRAPESISVRIPGSMPNNPRHKLLTSRQKVDKYNYFSSDFLGRKKLNDYLWNQATSTGEDGPALAASREGDPAEARVMDFRFDLPGAANSWSAADFLADAKNVINLSSYTGIELPIMFLVDQDTDIPDIFLQIGEIGEAEDHHKDGVINSEDSSRMLEWNLTDYAETSKGIKDAWQSGGTWKILRITLTASQRLKLSSVRALRLIIDNTIAEKIEGRVILGPPRFDGNLFRIEIRNDSNELASKQYAAGIEVADDTLDSSLETAFPEVSSLFHQKNEKNKVLKLSWGDDVSEHSEAIGANDRWEAVSWFSGIPMEAYGTLVFFVYDETGSGAITAKMTDKEGSGIEVTWTSSKRKKWDRIKIDIAKGTASSALGNSIERIAIDNYAGELTRFVLNGADAEGDASKSVNSGTIYFDEVYFRDPAFSVAGGAQMNAYWRYEEEVAAIGSFPILGDIALEGGVDISGGTVISGVGKKDVAYGGSIGIGTDILGMKLNTDWQGAWNLGKSNWSASHSLRIPANYETFWFKDTYSRGKSGEILSFSRSNDLNLKLDVGWLRAFSDALYDSSSIVQSWGTETAWKGGRWNTELGIKYIMNSKKFEAKSEDYFSSWIKDYALLWPAGGEVFNREIHHALDVNANIETFSAEWSPELRLKANRAPKWNQENRWAGILSFPIRFPSWSITPSYRRNFRQLVDTNGDGNENYGDVWYNFITNARGQFPLFTYVPFRELFGLQDGQVFERATEGLPEANYEVEVALDVRRVVKSSFIDLFVPNYTNFSIEREYLRKGDTVGWENEWRGTMGFEAVNLFGRFGTYPIFSAYNSEHLSTLLQIVLKDLNGTSAPAPYELLWQSNWIFTGKRRESFIFNHRIHWHWNDRSRETRQEAKLEYRWRTATKDVLRLPLFKRAILSQNYLENREHLLLRGKYPWKDAPDTTVFSMAVTVHHESVWVFSDVGEFRVWLALGLGAFGEEFSNGWEMGIEAKLHF